MPSIDKFWLSTDGRLFALMHTLLYPGVLGSLMYALPDNLSKHQGSYEPVAIWLAAAFFLSFSLDYVHSIREEVKPIYGPKLFALDLVIVALLFFAGQRLLGTPLLAWASVPAMLALAKFAAALWEVVAETKEDSARNTDFLLAAVYGGIAILVAVTGDRCWPRPPPAAGTCWDGWSGILAAALVLDALSFLYYKSLARVFSGPRA